MGLEPTTFSFHEKARRRQGLGDPILVFEAEAEELPLSFPLLQRVRQASMRSLDEPISGSLHCGVRPVGRCNLGNSLAVG